MPGLGSRKKDDKFKARVGHMVRPRFKIKHTNMYIKICGELFIAMVWNLLRVLRLWTNTDGVYWPLRAFPRESWDTSSGHYGKWRCISHPWRRWWGATCRGCNGCCLVRRSLRGSGKANPRNSRSVLQGQLLKNCQASGFIQAKSPCTEWANSGSGDQAKY